MGGQTALNLAKELSEVRHWPESHPWRTAPLVRQQGRSGSSGASTACLLNTRTCRPAPRNPCLQRGILAKYGVELIGAKLESINKAEDRELFANVRV